MVRIGIDASGGDNGEIEVIKSVVSALKINNDICFTILGVKDVIIQCFSDINFKIDSRIKIIDAKEKIEMNDHPVFALRSKPNSSIYLAGLALQNNEIDIFISAGNTGALVALSQFYLKPINGVDRPVVAAIVPTEKNPMLLIDSGCNVDSKPEWLYQYALLGNVYIKEMLNIDKPRIGLLSVGTEENKGNALTLATFQLLNNNKDLNFIGNVEARDVPFGICDILITDGFAGNVLLKTYEGTAKMIFSNIKKKLMSSFISKIGAMLALPVLKNMLLKFNAKIYGGAPILGANYFVLKCHGNATNIEYQYAIKQAYYLVKNNIVEIIKKSLEV